MIRLSTIGDFEKNHEIINDSALAYKGVIPEDRWCEPYMPKNELREEIDSGVVFYCYEEEDDILGVMGFQDKGDVNLIRHAYIRTNRRKSGIGSLLLKYLVDKSDKPILIGAWKDAVWAVNFYIKNGFYVVQDKNHRKELFLKYWNVSERQMEESVVLKKADCI